MRKATYSLFAFMVFSAISGGVANAQVELRGLSSCGAWTAVGYASRLKEATQDSIDRLVKESWIVGYLSGIASGTNKDFIRGTDNPSILLWVDNYCRANPLKDLGDAGSQLARDLIKQKQL